MEQQFYGSGFIGSRYGLVQCCGHRRKRMYSERQYVFNAANDGLNGECCGEWCELFWRQQWIDRCKCSRRHSSLQLHLEQWFFFTGHRYTSCGQLRIRDLRRQRLLFTADLSSDTKCLTSGTEQRHDACGLLWRHKRRLELNGSRRCVTIHI